MHTHDLDISIHKLSKIEGHADLDIKVRDGEVTEVNLRVMENVRFFNQAVRGKSYNNVAQLVSRICGTCSIAHMTACTEAVEKAMGIVPSEQTMLLRKLMMHSLMIRDHALHLYFFVLPDMYKVDSVLDLAALDQELVHQALHVKEAGNLLSKLVAGRSVHALYEQIGGFSHFPDPEETKKVIAELESVRSYAIELVRIFKECPWKLDRDINFVAIKTKDFSYLEGDICSTDGTCIPEKEFYNHLQNSVLPFVQATGFDFEGKEYMIGSLSRLNVNQDALHPDTKRDLAETLKLFPSKNIYHNNLAQAIEIVHSIDQSLEILRNTEFKPEPIVEPARMTGEGVGAIEAPRGILYYWVGIEEGKVRYANLVIPTAQNLHVMREDVRVMVKNDFEKGEEYVRMEAEKIIRAYDPCMSCACHFLRVNVKKS